MEYDIMPPMLNSRRGKYQVVRPRWNPQIWEPRLLDPAIPRHVDVMDEVEFAISGKLHEHKYWQDEPISFINEYQKFYRKLFSMNWIGKNTDRHSIVVNRNCCLTLVQYHDHRLIAYSRSTDVRNGYYSDRLILEYLAQMISTNPQFKVEQIIWFMAVPHVYKEKGIARLKKDEETI